MKKLFTLLACLALSTGIAQAQCSNNFYKLEKGTEYEMTVFNKKDKAEGIIRNIVMAVEDKGGAQHAIFHSKIFDKKDKLMSEGDYTLICEGDKIKIDMRRLFSSMPQFSNDNDMTMKVAGDYIEIPSHLEVGATLPETKSNMTMQMGNSEMHLTSTDVLIKNRKVEGKEDITTPAGTFNCYKIIYDLDMNMKVMGINRKMNNKGAEWIAEGVGVVKTASYDKDGSLESYTLLTNYK